MKKILCLLCSVIILLSSCTAKKDDVILNSNETDNITTESETVEDRLIQTTVDADGFIEVVMPNLTDEERWSYSLWLGDGKECAAVEYQGEFSFTFMKQYSDDFIISDYTGDYIEYNSYSDESYRVGPHIFKLSGESLTLYVIYYHLFSMDWWRPGLEFFEVINANRNIKNCEKWAEDTPERRETLAKVFRVYINDIPVSGILASYAGNNSDDYVFYFDRYYSLDEIDTVRLELGYKEN